MVAFERCVTRPDWLTLRNIRGSGYYLDTTYEYSVVVPIKVARLYYYIKLDNGSLAH
jgi:hypothetical protein